MGRTLLLFALLFPRGVSAASRAQADPVTIAAEPIPIASGTVQAVTSIHAARISLQGDAFFIRTSAEDDFLAGLDPCRPCASPVVDLGASWNPTGFPCGEALFNGVHYDQVILGPGTFARFTTPSATLTGIRPQTLTVPFTFSALFDAFSDQSIETHLFTASVEGTGIARARFRTLTDDSELLYDNVTFPGKDFQLEYQPSPVPEPGTLLLIGSGSLALVARRHRRRRL